MKRSELIKAILKKGAILIRHGAGHDIYVNPSTGNQDSVPRHNEIKDLLAKSIIKKLS
ncbi:type II toxin-antitoxin system HicA family toxin [Breznakiellaceae bacterium SP9]